MMKYPYLLMIRKEILDNDGSGLLQFYVNNFAVALILWSIIWF